MTEPVLKLEHEEYFYAMKKQKDKEIASIHDEIIIVKIIGEFRLSL